MDIEERLLKGNKKFVRNVNKKLLDTLSKSQNPYALIVTCSDSRVVPEHIFSTSLGELFVIRTAGNVINEGELASIEYGIEHLNIQYVLILGHTHCGAVHAAIQHEKGKYLSCILDNISNAIKDEKDECQASILNALAQVMYLKTKFPEYKGKIKAGLYDISTGQVKIF